MLMVDHADEWEGFTSRAGRRHVRHESLAWLFVDMAELSRTKSEVVIQRDA
jgi:hypothetical protein